jgi:2-keto-4-pentenoate hydratase
VWSATSSATSPKSCKTPDYGFLLANRFTYEGEKVRLDQSIAPFVPAFVPSKDLRGSKVTIADVISAIDYAAPATETSIRASWTIKVWLEFNSKETQRTS